MKKQQKISEVTPIVRIEQKIKNKTVESAIKLYDVLCTSSYIVNEKVALTTGYSMNSGRQHLRGVNKLRPIKSVR